MARHDESGGVSALVRHTAGMAELAISAGHPDRKHNEYLPYPDHNFNDPVNDQFQIGSYQYFMHVSHIPRREIIYSLIEYENIFLFFVDLQKSHHISNKNII